MPSLADRSPSTTATDMNTVIDLDRCVHVYTAKTIGTTTLTYLRSWTSFPKAACSRARFPCCGLHTRSEQAKPVSSKGNIVDSTSASHWWDLRARTVLELSFLQILEQVLVPRRRLVVCARTRVSGDDDRVANHAVHSEMFPNLDLGCARWNSGIPMAGLIWFSRIRCSC